LLLYFLITASDAEKARETIAKKREAEEKELEGKTTRETNEIAAFAGSLRNTQRKRRPEEASKVSKRQNSFRNLPHWIDIHGPRSVAIQ
jgi:hypothetical protein